MFMITLPSELERNFEVFEFPMAGDCLLSQDSRWGPQDLAHQNRIDSSKMKVLHSNFLDQKYLPSSQGVLLIFFQIVLTGKSLIKTIGKVFWGNQVIFYESFLQLSENWSFLVLVLWNQFCNFVRLKWRDHT